MDCVKKYQERETEGKTKEKVKEKKRDSEEEEIKEKKERGGAINSPLVDREFNCLR